MHCASQSKEGGQMNAILVFMGLSLVLGLWIKPRARAGFIVVTVAAFLLVIFFWLFPSQF